MPEKRDKANDTRERQTQRATILAALGGALIGALSGLAGSVLVYNEAEKTRQDGVEARQAEDAERRADIRRGAYVDLAASSNKFVDQATALLAASFLPQNSAEDMHRQESEKYMPAHTALVQSLATVRLVTTDEGRRGLVELGTTFRLINEKATNWNAKDRAEGFTEEHLNKLSAEFLSAEDKHLAALRKFLDRAAHEVL
ncbi:hypothetical protein [Streptomyces sp. NRRL S-244]|uniref:hypothetical protein n=1 Tax=Streptomyces sp. NRRL S-244 TaxID=1463897 RepID=UPI00131A54AA|nr:hypothetical protein [Streptomyces sp. NRRL S-244]